MNIRRDSTPEEKNAYNRAYYADRKVELRAKAKARRHANIEHYKEWARNNSRAKRAKDPEKIRKLAAEYRAKNREKIRAYAKAYRIANIEKHKEYSSRYHSKHGDKIRASQNAKLAITRKTRWANDPQFRIGSNARRRIHAALKAAGVKKNLRTVDILGCTVAEFHAHLESQFTGENGFTWENYGAVWEIDHIIPVVKFDLSDPEQVKKAFHYSNCQPLRGVVNRMKGDKLPHELNQPLVVRVCPKEQVASLLPADVAH